MTATRLSHWLARLDSNRQQYPAVVIIEITATGMVSLGSVLNVDLSRADVGCTALSVSSGWMSDICARAVKERQAHHGPVPPLYTAISQTPASRLHINEQTQTHTVTHVTAVRSMEVKEQTGLFWSFSAFILLRGGSFMRLNVLSHVSLKYQFRLRCFSQNLTQRCR